MKRIELTKTIVRTYKNNGDHAEQVVCYNLTGIIKPHNNVPFWVSGDIGSMQVKYPEATICKGTDIDAYIKLNAADTYGIVSADFTELYTMNAEEFKQFVEKFARVTTNSKGETILKLRTYSIEMWMYLKNHVS